MADKEFYNFLGDEEELKWFFDHCVFEPKSNEVFCFALAARNKKLSEDERKEYGLGRAEMLNTNIVSMRDHEAFNFNKWERGVLKFEVNKKAMLTRTGMSYPEKSTVIYYYIHTSDEMKVLNEGAKYINDMKADLINAAMKGSAEGVQDAVKKLKSARVNVERMHARCPGTKKLIDFDMDIDPDYMDRKYDIILEALKKNFNKTFGKGNYFIVDTSGGFHVLVKKEFLKSDPNKVTVKVCEDVETMIPTVMKKFNEFGYNKLAIKEFNINKNSLIPLPGTLQYGRLVKIINKEDFE